MKKIQIERLSTTIANLNIKPAVLKLFDIPREFMDDSVFIPVGRTYMPSYRTLKQKPSNFSSEICEEEAWDQSQSFQPLRTTQNCAETATVFPTRERSNPNNVESPRYKHHEPLSMSSEFDDLYANPSYHGQATQQAEQGIWHFPETQSSPPVTSPSHYTTIRPYTDKQGGYIDRAPSSGSSFRDISQSSAVFKLQGVEKGTSSFLANDFSSLRALSSEFSELQSPDEIL